MILLNDIVEVLITSHLNILPLRILAPQKPKRHVTLQVAIERDLARPPRHTFCVNIYEFDAVRVQRKFFLGAI